MAKARKGMGFRAALDNVMRNSGVGRDSAAAILAAGARNASPAAKAANPNLKKVAGASKGKATPKGKSAPKGKAASAKKSSGKKAAPKKKASKK